MKRLHLILLPLLLLIISVPLRSQEPTPRQHIEADSVIAEAMKYLGTPYKWGGKTPKGFDCAGFVRYIYGKFGVLLPPSAAPQYKMGIAVNKEELAIGDLVFFGGRHKSKIIGHVGIVTDVHDGEFVFIHSATSTGITLTSSTEPYYKKRYIGACRIIGGEEAPATDTILSPMP